MSETPTPEVYRAAAAEILEDGLFFHSLTHIEWCLKGLLASRTPTPEATRLADKMERYADMKPYDNIAVTLRDAACILRGAA